MEKVLDYIRSHRDAFVEELFEVLRIPSISAQTEHRGDMVRCAEHLAAALVKAGADHAEVMPTEGNPVGFAEKVVEEIDMKKALGIGVFTVDGKMIDIAFYDGAKRTIDLAKASGVYKGDL